MCNVTTNSESTCKYLFGKEASQLFNNNIKFQTPQEKKEFIDHCLQVSMEINLFLLEKKDSFFLLDPVSFTNQCHLFSLKAARLLKGFSEKSTEQKLERSEENRFLHLSLFLSYSFINNPNLYVSVVKEALKTSGIQAPKPNKKFFLFLMDEGKYREKATRIALNDLFESSLKQSLSSAKEESGLYLDLFNIANEELRIETNHRFKEKVYTFPKFAGVAYMIDLLAKEKIAFVIKVKVVSKEGVAGRITIPSRAIDTDEPVLVFESIATDGTLTLEECSERAKECPNYFYRDSNKNVRHKESDSCFFCKENEKDLTPYITKVNTVMAEPENMFYALGADFVVHMQNSFVPMFQDEKKYPSLAPLFQKAVPKIKELGLDMTAPTTFSVCHVHTDTAAHALENTLLLDCPPELLLKKRGLL